MSTIPEESWPTIPIVAPKPADPELVGELVDTTDDVAVDELLEFYRSVLVPQLVCGNDDADPWPQRTWLQREERPVTAIAVRRPTGELAGVWCVREGQILAPCVDPALVASAFRALWDESTKHVDYLYGSSENTLIMRFAEAAMRKEPLPTSPTLSADGTRVEWRRG